MPSHSYVTVDVFAPERFGGNQLAVVTDARGLSAAAMQRIAAEFNYSETTFVLPPEEPSHTARVRIFTPTDELPFAGHPNVGTAYVLGVAGEVCGRRLEGDALAFEERAGLVAVRLVRDGGAVVGGRVRAPRPLDVGPPIDPDLVAACASLDPSDVATGRHPPRVLSVGLPFAVAELTGLEALGRARPDSAAFTAADRRHPHADDRFALFLYCFADRAAGRIRARMFAPLSNIVEDPATGSASAALGAYLASMRETASPRVGFVVEQGVEMGRRSVIDVEAVKEDGLVREVWIAGRCVPVMRGVLEVG